MEKVDAIIIGAGISGLSLSHHLNQKGIGSLILEKSGQTGGWINSEQLRGTIVENGPHTLVYNESVQQLIKELNLSPIVINPKTLERFIIDDEHNYQKVPSSPLEAIKTPLIPNLSLLKGLISLIKPWSFDGDDISVGDFFSNKLGTEIVSNLLDPALSGIWACDVYNLSLRSAMPSIWNKIKNGESLRKKRGNKYRGFVSFNNGLEELTKALEKNANIQLNCNIQKITISDSITLDTLGNSYQAKKIFITTDLGGAIETLGKIYGSDHLISQLSTIPLSSIGISHYQVPKNKLCKGFGFLVPSKNQFDILGCIFSSNIFPERGNSGLQLLSCFSGGAHWPEMAKVYDANVQDKVKQSLARIIKEDRTKLELISSKEAIKAIPNYSLGHYKTCIEIDKFEEAHNNRIKLLGTYRDGISLGNRIDKAKEATNFY